MYITLSALSYDDEREKDKIINRHYGDIYNEAKSRNLLLSLNKDYESFLYGESGLSVNNITLSTNDKFTWNLCRLLMARRGMLGEVLFIAFISQGIIVYPHKDTGFGVISMNSKLRPATELLSSVAHDERLSVYMPCDFYNVMEKIAAQ